MRRTTTSLSDGRELIYFDDDATAATTGRDDVKDTRDLERTATSSEIRYDALLDEWVAVASHRQSRTYLPPANECPLCPSRDGHPTEIPAGDYDVVVFENRFPSFATDVELAEDGVRGGERRPGLGRCEVVVFTSDHDLPVSQLSPQRVRLILDAWVDRTEELGRLPFVEQVFCFENRGQEIGVTLNHPHGQIYAYPFVTPRTRVMLDNARRHRERTGRDLFADRLETELADGARVVTTSEHWVAFVPFAARWPVEVHLYPRRRVPDLPALEDAVRDDFPEVYLRVLKALDGLYGVPLPYISGWHQAPVRVDRDLASLHLEVFSVKRAADKLKFLAGSESGMGAFVNDIAPERTAAMLREHLPPMTSPDEVRSSFRDLAGHDPAGVWSSPGRVNLIGEHTDYNDGYALPFGIPARAWVAVGPRDDRMLRMRSVQRPGDDATVPLDELAPGQLAGWTTYVAGVVWAARKAGVDVPGLDVLVDGRVPPGSGLSSSHALECAVATALNDVLDAGLDRNALARLSQVTENDFVGAPTGMLDQMASLHARRGHALFLDNRTLFVEQVPLDPASAGLRLVIVDTTVHHDNADGAYGERRAACERAASVLGVPALRDVPLSDLADALDRLPDDEARRCVRHVVTEDQRVLDAVAALRSGDWAALAAAMDASHASLRDDYRVSSPELDVAVETARAAGALGARMTGAGFGGSTISLVPEERVTAVRAAVARAFGQRGWAEPVVGATEPADGARRDA